MMTGEIPGLIYLSDYLDQHQREWLLHKIDAQHWSTEIKRRVQHYGYKYDYRKRSIDSSMALGDLPDWLHRLAAKVQADDLMPTIADQVIVNEYLPGQGISAHIDCEPCFGSIVVSISLGSGCIMDLRQTHDLRHVPLLLESGSLLVLSGEARYDWTHGIAARSADVFQGRSYLRGRRVSVTLRTVLF
jgi:alkylated DNA repair dioxygenase AlkB